AHTCGRMLRPTARSTLPDTMSALPSASVVTVGYQRPAFMSGSRDHTFSTGSYRPADFRPTSLLICPPPTNSRPSASSVSPEQNGLKLACATEVIALVIGSQTRGSSVYG